MFLKIAYNQLEQKKQQKRGDRLRSLISSKKQEFEKSFTV
jgi:hypothetical protein